MEVNDKIVGLENYEVAFDSFLTSQPAEEIPIDDLLVPANPRSKQ